MIRTGGCSSTGQLSAQFNYLFSKSVDIHDSRGLLDGAKTLSPEQIEAAVSRWADHWKGQMNAARTSHLLMSFPRGTKPSHVSLIAGEICREKLGGRFDYMIAVHTDSPNKNPHAHIIVNRRGEDGDYFILRRGTDYSYEAFKEAMVDHADRYGIRLEATSRLQRGISLIRPPTKSGGGLGKRRCNREPLLRHRKAGLASARRLSVPRRRFAIGPCAIASWRALPRSRTCRIWQQHLRRHPPSWPGWRHDIERGTLYVLGRRF
ncbi:relaxase/mobilization nuclease domain-containing protein [Paracoccus aerius]